MLAKPPSLRRLPGEQPVDLDGESAGRGRRIASSNRRHPRVPCDRRIASETAQTQAAVDAGVDFRGLVAESRGVAADALRDVDRYRQMRYNYGGRSSDPIPT
jgi:hypothetical protein